MLTNVSVIVPSFFLFDDIDDKEAERWCCDRSRRKMFVFLFL